jgi:hypothetical protein
MAIKRTHIYRGHAIVHHVFATDQTNEKIERFVVGLPGKNNQLSTNSTLAEAQAWIDETLTPRARFIIMESA